MSQANTLMTPRVIPSNYTLPEHEVLDLGAFKQLGAEINVLTAGGQGGENMLIETAAINEDTAFKPIPGMLADMGTAGTTHVYTDQFMRYIRAKASGTVTGSPVVAINTISKA